MENCMWVMKVRTIGYIRNDNEHTINYNKQCLAIIGNGQQTRESDDYNIKGVVSESYESGLVVLQKEVTEFLHTHPKLNSEDFFFQVSYDLTEDGGTFWTIIDNSNMKRYRVSDLEIVTSI